MLTTIRTTPQRPERVKPHSEIKEITIHWTYTSSQIPNYVMNFVHGLSWLRDKFN
jgi:hypothetical protein